MTDLTERKQRRSPRHDPWERDIEMTLTLEEWKQRKDEKR